MKKVLCLVLCLLMCVSLFTGCNRTMTMKEIMEKPETVVGKVGDQDIYAYEVLYLMAMQYSADDAFNEIKTVKVMLQKAIDLKIELDDNDKKEADDQIKSMVEQYGGQKAFEQVLRQFGLTYDQYKKISLMSAQVSKLNEKVSTLGEFKEATDAEATKFVKDNFIKAKHILLSTIDTSTQEALSEEVRAQKKQQAEDVAAKIKNGEAFENFESLNEDPGAAQSPEGYILAVTSKIADETTKSALQQYGFTMVEEFEKAAAGLKPGEVSGVVETNFGYHIIKRVEMTEDDVKKTAETVKNVLNNQKYLNKIDEWEQGYKVKKYDKIVSSLNVEEMQKILKEKYPEDSADTTENKNSQKNTDTSTENKTDEKTDADK